MSTFFSSIQDIKNWYQTPLGRKIFRLEQRQLDTLLPHIFGYYAICLTNHADFKLTESPILNKIDVACASPQYGQLVMSANTLAFANNSIDLFVLPHTLELLPDPDAILNEIYRCLIPEGKLIILGFNPYSLFGLWQWLLGDEKTYPWSNRFLSPFSVLKKLHRHQLQMECLRHFYFRPPINHTEVLKKLSFMELLGSLFLPYWGSLYIIEASKHVTSLTSIKPQFKETSLIKNYAPSCSRTQLSREKYDPRKF